MDKDIRDAEVLPSRRNTACPPPDAGAPMCGVRLRAARAGALLLLVGGLLFAQGVPAQQGAAQAGKDNLAGPYVPTPWEIVHEMLKLADVDRNDTLYDLGSGDGRLVITAAKRHGARGVGIELQVPLVEAARERARSEGVGERVTFVAADLFETEVSGASVVTLYLLPRFVTRLVPKLRAELAPGSRIVSHDYALAPWPPDKTLIFNVPEKEFISGSPRTTLYYYVVPAPVAGRWSVALPPALGAEPLTLQLVQEPDRLEGVVESGGETFPLRDLAVRADSIRFELLRRSRLMRFQGTVTGGSMSGEVRSGDVAARWSGRRTEPVR